jgi:hypothetical protein
MDNSKPEIVHGICEMCGTPTNNNCLYVDMFNNTFALECPACFYARNNGNVTGYYERVASAIPSVYNEKAFNKHKKAMIVIGDAYVYTKIGGEGVAFSNTEKESCLKDAMLKMFDSDKIRRKFERVNVEYKLREENQEGGAILKIAIRAYVRFNSYLEFLEHEFYMHFRKEIKTIFTLDKG